MSSSLIRKNNSVAIAPIPSSNWRASLRCGWAVAILGFGTFGAWAAVARLDSAVLASSVIAVESNRKTIQHLEGGIIKKILVRDGDAVKEGDVLVSLDPIRAAATADTHRQQLAMSLALDARLVAQRDGRDRIEFPDEVRALVHNRTVAIAIADQERQFASRAGTLRGSVEVIDAQISQGERDIQSNVLAARNAEDQLKTIARELPGLRQLLEKQLVTVARVTTLERKQLELQGVLDGAKVNIRKNEEKIKELKLRIEQLNREYHQEAADQLPDVRKAADELREQIKVAEDALKRIDVRAPVSGTVQQMRVFTPGGVVRPGDPILDVVPDSDRLVVQAKVSPLDVDRIVVGMPVEVQLPQFQQYQNLTMQGKVTSVSRDRLIDESTSTKDPYFAMEVAVDRSTVPDEVNQSLTAGMTVMSVVLTGERTALQYFVSPILNRITTSMRER